MLETKHKQPILRWFTCRKLLHNAYSYYLSST